MRRSRSHAARIQFDLMTALDASLRGAALAAGAVADAVLGDPRRGHPVALFGAAAGRWEQSVWADSRARGLLYSASCVLPMVGAGLLVQRLPAPARFVVAAACAWTVLGGRSLIGEGSAIAGLLGDGDLVAARERLTFLVGRDTADLDEAQISRAVIESIAENTCDAVVAPLFWGAIAGAPGLLGYRAANTLDAMVGHKSARYLRFGWASARLDDFANLGPARLSAALIAVCAPVVGGSPRASWAAVRRWGREHPSPNSGLSEAAFAGALGVQLGGRNRYGDRVEDRPLIGDGAVPRRDDIARARRLCAAATALAAATAAVASAAAAMLRARPARRAATGAGVITGDAR